MSERSTRRFRGDGGVCGFRSAGMRRGFGGDLFLFRSLPTRDLFLSDLLSVVLVNDPGHVGARFAKRRHSPILLYGTFDGKIMFAEASVTPATLQDAIAAPSHVISFRFRQPRTVQGGVAWPTRFAIQYLPSSGTFRAAFEAFRKR